MNNEHVSKKIKQILEEIGMTQGHLAKKLGVTPLTVSRILQSEDVTKNKHFDQITKIIGVSKSSIVKEALLVDDLHLKDLITRDFVLSDKEKTQMKDCFIKSTLSTFFFAHRPTIDISDDIKAGSLMIYSVVTDNNFEESNFYIVLSSLNQSFIIGKLLKNGENLYLVNKNGKYPIQEKDKIVGQAIQVMLYLKESN